MFLALFLAVFFAISLVLSRAMSQQVAKATNPFASTVQELILLAVEVRAWHRSFDTDLNEVHNCFHAASSLKLFGGLNTGAIWWADLDW